MATATEAAIAVVLLVGVSTLGRSYAKLLLQHVGISGHVLAVTVSYPDRDSGVQLQGEIDEALMRLRRIPGAEEVAATTGPMVDGFVLFGSATVDGNAVLATPKQVTARYFETLGTRVVAGRPFGAGDDVRMAIVNRAFARRYWRAGDVVVGKQIGTTDGPATVIGLVEDSNDVALDSAPGPTIFSPLHNPSGCQGDCNRITFVVRAAAESESIVRAAETAVSASSVHAAPVEDDWLSDRLAGSVRERSFALLVLILYAMAALGICILGLVGTVSFTMTRRMREIAIKIVLGARWHEIVWSCAGDTLTGVVMGWLVGLAVGSWSTTLLRHLLYEVAPGDLVSVSSAGAALLLLAVLASVLTVSRAWRVPPAVILRSE